ncbi:MAG TPA: hypothetical protein EYN66_05080 [Myxococcales bacterium]|nr:hypothetical protein [Myxococcales bacterium]
MLGLAGPLGCGGSSDDEETTTDGTATEGTTDEGTTDEGTTDGGPTDSAGDDSKALNTTSKEEIIAMCMTVDQEAMKEPGAQHLACLGVIVIIAKENDEQSCTEVYDMCMEYKLPLSDCHGVANHYENCAATIGELKACLSDTMAALVAKSDEWSKLDCDSISNSITITDLKALESSASCVALGEKCFKTQ